MPLAHVTKIEDARTGQWLRTLDPLTDPIHRIDMGWTMGDWNQLDVSVETVALRESHLGRTWGYTADARLAEMGRLGPGATSEAGGYLGKCRPAVYARARRCAAVELGEGQVDAGGGGQGASEAKGSGLGRQGEYTGRVGVRFIGGVIPCMYMSSIDYRTGRRSRAGAARESV